MADNESPAAGPADCKPSPESIAAHYYKRETRKFARIKTTIRGGRNTITWYALTGWTAAGEEGDAPGSRAMLPADWHPPLTKSVTDSTGNPCTARRVTLSSPISGPWPDGPWVVTVPPPLPYENGEPPTVGLTIGSAVVTAVDTLETLTAVRRMKVSWVGEATYECDRRPPAKKSPVR